VNGCVEGGSDASDHVVRMLPELVLGDAHDREAGFRLTVAATQR
jgi:hypothetical protein